ncbi:MAG: porin family protein [Flavihumibacter sp.]|nr:porin family protein [Flavihumibacter sp.]
MKKRFFGLTVFLLLLHTAHAQVNWAVKAGFQYGSATIKLKDEKIASGSLPGLNIGIATRVPIDKQVYFAPGFHYTIKAYSIAATSTAPQKDYRFTYLELPVLLQINFSEDAEQGAYFKIGPSLGLAIKGKETFKNSFGNVTNNKLKFSFGEYGYADAAAHAFLGYTFKGGFFAEAGIVQNLGSISNDDFGPKITPRQLTVNLGYFIK